MTEDNIKAPANQREYCRAERIRRGSEFFIRVGLWAPYLIRGESAPRRKYSRWFGGAFTVLFR